MKITYIFSAIACIGLLAIGCKSQNGKLAFVNPSPGQSLTLGQKLTVKMQFPDTTIDSVIYSVDGDVIARKQDTSAITLDTESLGLGSRNLVAKAYKAGKEESAFSNINVVPESPQQYGFEKVNTYPHDTLAFTQGLEFDQGFLYESTGSGSGLTTSLRKVDLVSGKVLKKIELTGADAHGEPYFGEGLTLVDDKVIMLTWLNKVGYIYNKASFERLGSFNYQASQQGWGLCYDGTRLIKTDASNKLIFLDAQTYAEQGSITVYDENGPLGDNLLNELEYIDGKVYANLYGTNTIAIINPANGVVEGKINFVGLYPKNAGPDHEMNGIAYDKVGKRLFVTGKQWDSLFEVKIIAR